MRLLETGHDLGSHPGNNKMEKARGVPPVPLLTSTPRHGSQAQSTDSQGKGAPGSLALKVYPKPSTDVCAERGNIGNGCDMASTGNSARGW